MNLGVYAAIIGAMCFVPPTLTFVFGIIVWYCYKKSAGFMLIMMKSTISQMSIERKPTYLVCRRKLPSSSRKYFMIYSLMIFTICVQCFFLLVCLEVSYECINDPDLDCFKEIDGVILSATLLSQLPVNCSAISQDDFVFCYRTTLFDPEKAFYGAAAAYILFELLNIVLVVLAHLMIFLAGKFKNMTVVKIVITIICFGLGIGFFVLRSHLNELKSATRKISYTVLVQGGFVMLLVFLYVVMLPWRLLDKREEYYAEASLPIIVGAHDNECAHDNEIVNDNEMRDVKQ